MNGKLKFGIFVNSQTNIISEEFSHLGYDWLLIGLS